MNAAKTLKTPAYAKTKRRARKLTFKPTAEISAGTLSDDEATNAACVALGQDKVFQAGLMRAFALVEALTKQKDS